MKLDYQVHRGRQQRGARLGSQGEMAPLVHQAPLGFQDCRVCQEWLAYKVSRVKLEQECRDQEEKEEIRDPGVKMEDQA